MVPVFRVRLLDEALPFYRDVLGFSVHKIEPDIASFYAVLSWNGHELHLQQDSDAIGFRCSAIIGVDDVDATFTALRSRGYCPPDRPESPVHSGPVNQTWGTREVYIDDPSGNTLCFAGPLPNAA
jgi:catechol 2,3-dioxygenase-like lactoylglutathione lyase family enzyme